MEARLAHGSARVMLVLVSLLAAGPVARAAEESPIGKQIVAFSARDIQGQPKSLIELADRKFVVVVFLGTECPLAKLYAPRLVELNARYRERGVAFLAVCSNQQDSIAELTHYATKHGIDFPILKDLNNVIADQFGAIRTPEVFVLDGQRKVRYWGRIDDQFGFDDGIAYQRSEPKRRDLAIAIDELLEGKPVTQAVARNQGCHIGRVKKPDPASEVTYSSHIASILNSNCVFCHRQGQIAPFPLTSYDEAVGWAEMSREVVNENRMPPWHADPKVGHFGNDARLSDRDKELLNQWVDNGAPLGDPGKIPPAPKFAEGWQIPEPDQVFYMAEKPFTVPASGTVEYQRFTVDPGWTEDKWIQAMECVPGNPAVVHHIIVYVVPPGVTPTGQAGRLRSNWLGAFAPGLRQSPLEPGYARYVQKGSKLLFEMHYTANGSEQPDRSYVGFVFADPKTVKKEVAVQNAGNFTFKIPPHAPNHEVEAEYQFRHNTLLLTMSPHMHVRGKDFRYDIVFPDGKRESLLWIPRYDFGWQTTYELKEPKLLPKGSKMVCVAHFDNSEDNLANPDPTREVGWGEQTWEEMMFGWFEMALADQDLTKPASASAKRSQEFQAAAGSIVLDDTLKSQARAALESEHAFERFTWQLMELVPQLDRVCITSVEDGKLRLKHIHQRLGLRTSLHSKATVVKAAGQSLADYAASKQAVVNQAMSGAKGSIMAGMASKDIRSSMHVPIEFDGAPATVNFWSAEPEAFGPEAVKLLEEVAKFLSQGRAVAAK